jgi:hypothetical protein
VAVDSYTEIWSRVKAVAPAAGPLLAQRWTIDGFRRIAERRCWSWLVRFNQFILPDQYATGTVTVTQNSTTVTGSGTAWDASMVNRQFRIGNSTPIYTITAVTSATSLELQFPWGGATQGGVTYSIYQCYFTPPSDFRSFLSLYDPNFNWQLRLNISQQELNSWDAQRANTGQAYCVASYDYSMNETGTVSAPVQIIGNGPSPILAGNAAYTGAANALYTILITTGGAIGTAAYEWKKDGGAFSAPVLTDAGGAAQELSQGVFVIFPAGTYIVNDVFVIRTSVANSPGIPRYELWPHNQSNYVYPYLYEAIAQDLNEPGAVLPRFIRGDLVMDMALLQAAQWPGESVDSPNPYYDLNLADRIRKSTEWQINELERQDEETYLSMVSYATNLQFSPFFDARYIQQHAIF